MVPNLVHRNSGYKARGRDWLKWDSSDCMLSLWEEKCIRMNKYRAAYTCLCSAFFLPFPFCGNELVKFLVGS